ncbi:MAG: phosphatidate cytidylyltransferase, partial [Mesorhizobium sp.]
VWATDISAYFVGRAVGGPKLAPSISPGKTQSGALGGAVGGVVAGLLLAAAAGAGNLAVLGVVALVLSLVSQAGD